jgi:hypothetical protein
MEQEVLDGFKKEIGSQILCFEKDLKCLKKQRKDNETYLINTLRNFDLKKRQIRDLKKFSKDVNTTIKEQVEQIKQLPFVKDVKLGKRGISIDVGRIDINYRNSDIYIGDFSIMITPKGVEIKNRNPIIVEDEYIYEHPHIDSDDICFGEERHKKIDEHFAKFQLKQLVYMVYLFLKTYTPNDCYNKITYWTQDAKRKERKQRAKINTEKVGEN